MEKERCGHFFNRCFATWAAITVPVGKFEFAIAAHDLVLFLGCHHPRIRRLGPQIVKLAKAKKVNVKLFSREQVMKVLIPDGKRTKHALAEIVAGQFPEQLGSKLPPKRKAWMREHYQMGIFDAVGLVFAFRKCHMESE
jgi:hypothetical protein